MKKGTKIKTVEISKKTGYVSAKDENDHEIKLSRSERTALANVKIKGGINAYTENVIKAFGGNPDVISKDCIVLVDDVVKFTYTKTKNEYN